MTRLACVLVMLGGCGLYWNDGGSGGGGVCNVPKEPAQPQLRDPQTGQCETISTSSCGPCEACPVATPTDWASCDTNCLGLNEATCLATAGCQVEYLDKGTLDYWGCFAVAPSGPVETPCDGLDAYSCSRHDNCIEVYAPSGTSSTFESCISEPAPPPPPPPPPACDTLTAEADCLARADCDAIYNGYNCTCDPSGCTCQTEVFARCQAR